MAEKKKQVISFGEYSNYVKVGGKAKEMHELLEKEKELLIKDFKTIQKIEKEENIEEKAVKHFEAKIQQLLETISYLEGYSIEIESGNEMLKHSESVTKLGEKLARGMEEVELLSKSMLDEEKKILELAKCVKQILDQARKCKNIISD